MAETLLSQHHSHLPGGVTLVPSSGGVFEITTGGQLVYSKKATGRFPEEGEAEQLVAQAVGA